MSTDGSTHFSQAVFRTRLAQRDGGSLDVPRFRAHLVKRIPLDVGLGGAASNAATALWGANELCGRPASQEELTEWSREIGSDVACFLVGSEGAALCSGRAIFHKPQEVRAVGPLAHSSSASAPEPELGSAAESDEESDAGGGGSDGLYIVTPTKGATPLLSTPRLFRILADSSYSTLSARSPDELVLAARDGAGADQSTDRGSSGSGAGDPADAYVNDLEAPALECSASLRVIRQELLELEGFRAARLLGAGPSLAAFGQLRSGDSAEALARRLARQCATAKSAEGPLDIQVRRVQFARRVGVQWYDGE